MNTVQLTALQFGSTAIAVVRPEKIVGEVLAVDWLTTSADAFTPYGPRDCQLTGSGIRGACVLSFLAAPWAPFRWASPIKVFGYAVLSYISCAKPSNRAASPLDSRPMSVWKCLAKARGRTYFAPSLTVALPSGFATNDGLGGLTATKANAAAAGIRVTAAAVRRYDRVGRVNQRVVFIIMK